MARQRKSYAREFKLEAVRLLETSGRGVTDWSMSWGSERAVLGAGEMLFGRKGSMLFLGKDT